MTKLTIGAAIALLSTAALAGPFADVGDRLLRQDVELLGAEGLITGPIDSWPMPWTQIDAGINAAHDGRELAPYVTAAVERVSRMSALAAQKTSVDARIDATNNVSVARDFGNLTRAKLDSAASVEWNSGIISIEAGMGIRSGQKGTAYNFEPSQIAIRLGNWTLYGGYTQQWFGPGQDGALLFSNSTRSFPKVGIKRLMPDPIDLPVLRWLGPVRLDFFVGVLDENRDYRNTAIVGTRLNFAPSKHWEFGLNRMQQLCGQGRPCGWPQISKSLFGIGNADNVGDQAAFLNQPGNQIAGFDISYRRHFGKVAAKLYLEAEAEDSDNIIIEQYARLVGMNLAGPWGDRGASWTATIEYADTYGAAFFNGTPLEKLTGGETRYPSSVYNNGVYTDGFTYYSMPIGYWTDGDSRNLSFAASMTDIANRRWYGTVRSVHLNISDTGNPPVIFPGAPGILVPVSYRVSANSEKFAILTGGVDMPTAFGDLHIEARYRTDSPNTPNLRQANAAIEIGLRDRF